jgi:phosphomannomutase/phosphoglucomutase
VGRGFGESCFQRGISGSIAVGRDNRPSGPALRDELVRGLNDAGLDVVDVGVVPTPVVYWCVSRMPVIGGVQITGSHNPPEYNGFKISLRDGSLHGDQIQELYQLYQSGLAARPQGSVSATDVLDEYAADMVARTGKLDRRLRVIFDCGNGASSVVASRIFDNIGADSQYLFCESDGTFPNHHPDPSDPANLEELIKRVVAANADLGIAFDGDADRIGVVDRHGLIVWGDHLLILYARDVLKRMGPGQFIIFDVKCSQALPHEISKAGGVPVMWKTGHSLIKQRMRDLQAPIAGEMSGHMFFSEGFYGHDDALYAAARLMRILASEGQHIDELLADVPKFVSTPEIRVECPEEIKFGVVQRAVDHFAARYDVIDVDGVRVLFGDGWGLIRASNTQPALVLRFEAQTEERLAQIRSEIEGWLRAQGVRV